MNLSIIVPLYNEEDNIAILYNSLKDVVDQLNCECEIIFIDDGSTDKTFSILRDIVKKNKKIKAIKFRRNFGQTAAMQAGFDYAQGDVIISMDGDLQNDPNDIPEFLKKIEEGYDLICGWRKKRQDKLISRKVPSIVANWLISLISGIRIHDNGCSLKAYKKNIIKKARLYSEMHRFIPAITSLSGIKYTEIVVNHRARQYGASKYGISRSWKVFLDLLVIKMIISFSTKPAVWFSILSLPFLFLGVMSSIIAIVNYTYMPVTENFSIVLPSITALSFFMLCFLLVIGLASELILKTGDLKLEDIVEEEIF